MIKGIAVVTGAASGMGKAAAKLMAQAGWPLLLVDLDAERLAADAAEMGAETLAGDISSAGFSADLQAAIGAREVGALIHCAGLSPSMADAARILEVNLAATMRLVDAVREHMARDGAIVLFSSSSAYQMGAGMDDRLKAVTTPDEVANLLEHMQNPGLAYGLSKRAIQFLAQREALAMGATKGVRVTSVSPGIIDTPMGRQEMNAHPIMKAMVDGSGLKRLARAEEVAAVAAFLASPAASFVSGIDVLVDGAAIAGWNPADWQTG